MSIAVEIDEAAGFDDFFFRVGHVRDVQGNFLKFFADDVGLDVLHVAVEGCLDVGDIDVIADFKERVVLHLEGQHAPVDDVGAVALRRIFPADIGQAAEDALAAGRLFAGRAIAGLDAVNHAADFRRRHIGVGKCLFQLGKDVFQLLVDGGRALSGYAGPFCRVDCLGPADVFRVAAGQGEFSQSQRIGAVRRRFARRNQFVCRRHGIHDLRADLDQDIVGQGFHVRPVFDVRPVYESRFAVGLAEALVYARCVGRVVVVVRRFCIIVHVAFGRREDAAVGRRRRDGTGIHEGYGRELAAARLRAFAVREVARRMADAEGVVCRRIACSEAGAAEGRLENRPGSQKVGYGALADQIHVHGLGRRVDVEGKDAVAAGSVFQNMSGSHDVAVVAAGAAGNDALLDVEFAVDDLIHQAVMEVGIAHAAVDAFFRFMKDIGQIGVELVNGKGVARMHRHGDHRLDLAQIDVNDAVVVSHIGWIEFLVVLRPAVLSQVGLRVVVGAPY